MAVRLGSGKGFMKKAVEQQHKKAADKQAVEKQYKDGNIKNVTGDIGLDKMLSERPQYKGIKDNLGNLSPEYKVKQQKSNLSGLDQRLGNVKDVKTKGVNTGQNFKDAQQNIRDLQGRAFGTGTSKWAQARMNQADAANQEARNQMVQDIRRGTQANMNAMAMQGGLEGGSRERMMNQAGKNRMMSGQALARQNQQAKLGITADDEQQRLQLQGQLPGMNLQADSYSTGLQSQNAARDLQAQGMNQNAGLQKVNLWGGMASGERGQNQQVEMANKGNMIQDTYNQGNHDMQGWQTGMEAYSGAKTSDAQLKAAKAQKGGGLLGLGTPIGL